MVIGERQLGCVVREFVTHFNTRASTNVIRVRRFLRTTLFAYEAERLPPLWVRENERVRLNRPSDSRSFRQHVEKLRQGHVINLKGTDRVI